MADILNRLKSWIGALPRMYRFFLGILFVAELGLYLVTPEEPGLYSWKPQFIPFIVTLPFLFVKSVRKPFNRFVYSYALISFAFLALDYLAGGHAGLIQISVLFIPFGFYLLFRFGM